MKSNLNIYIILFIFSGIILFSGSCKKRPPRVILTTTDISEITQTSAVSGGNIAIDKKISVIERGVCWGVTTDPTPEENKTSNGTGTGSFLSTITGLQSGTDYYVRAYAITEKDTVYGRNISFSTRDYETMNDIEGNVYKIISVGSQTWMAENLKTTRYNDGTAIPLVKSESAWAGLSSAGYCWYKNEEEAFKPIYGALYNWYTINTEKLCPVGWHVPNDAEWAELTDFLGGESIAGGKLKEAGVSYWVEPNTGATNESGFSAFPGGFRYHDGKFFDFGFSGYWWASGNYSVSRGSFRFLYYDDTNLYKFDNEKRNGFSVRCLKD